MTNRAGQISRIARIICALALILVGFAHQPPRIPTTVPASEMAAYVLPDGTLPVLCDLANLDDDDHSHDPGRCEACVLSASTLLPPPPTLVIPTPRLAETLLPQDKAVDVANPFRLTAAPRGPPLFPHA